MECKERKMVSFKKGHTGVRRRSFVIGIGSTGSTPSRGEVRATSPNSLASQKTRFSFGCTSTASAGEVCRNLANSSTGAQAGLTTRCGTSEANSTRDGWAVSLQSGKGFMRAMSGNGCAYLCGSETPRVADGAGFIVAISRICRSTSITSCRLPCIGCVLKLPTSFFFAKCATTSFILGGM